MRIIIFMCIAYFCAFSNANEIQLDTIGRSSDRIKSLTEKLATGSAASVDDLEGDLIKQWLVSCKIDRFTSQKQCYLKHINNDLSLYRGGDRNYLSVGINHFPGKVSAIKIDNNPAINGKDGLIQNSSEAINQMRKGETAFTRYVRWPYEVNVDNEINLDGFEEAYEVMINRYNNLK